MPTGPPENFSIVLHDAIRDGQVRVEFLIFENSHHLLTCDGREIIKELVNGNTGLDVFE